jgi:DNA-binding MarR family transcriptional regulator
MPTLRSQPRDDRAAAGKRREIATVIDGLRSINQMLRHSARAAESELGISGAQLFVLQELSSNPATSINDLAERTFTHHSSVSAVVTRLVKSGLVSKRTSSKDSRRSEIALTTRGRQLLRRAPVAAQAQLTAAVSSLPAEVLAHLSRSVHRLTMSLAMQQEASLQVRPASHR